MQNQINTFFTKDVYDTEIRLDVNGDVLKRIYNGGINSTDKLPVEFVFITDVEENADRLKENLSLQYPTYTDLEVVETDWSILYNTKVY